jgi:hypothetical protein
MVLTPRHSAENQASSLGTAPVSGMVRPREPAALVRAQSSRALAPGLCSGCVLAAYDLGFACTCERSKRRVLSL